MQYWNFFFVLSLGHMYIRASPTTNPLELLGDAASTIAAADEASNKGYECGATFFSDSEIREALNLALRYSDLNSQSPQRYRGLLYSDTMITEYLLWPIKKGSLVSVPSKYVETSHRLVYTRNSKEAIDVISRTSTNDFTKCIRKGDLQSEVSTSISQPTDGFQCGHQFFKDEVIQESLSLALKRIGDDIEYPAPYIGPLFPEDRGYLLWPILSRGKLFKSGYGDTGPYFLVITREGQLIDILVKAYSYKFLRCSRSKEPPIALGSDLHRKLFVQPVRSGFQCGRTFFDDAILKASADLAQSMANFRRRKRFPEDYNGHPYDEPCLLWAIMRDGSLFKKGSVGPYRLVLTLDFKVLSVGITNGGQIKACDKITIKAKKNHDTSDYICHKRLFTNQKLVDTANLGCKSMEKIRKLYPARYEGPRFEKDGPYFTYPVFVDFFYTRNTGPDRVIINSDCELVGAITIIRYRSVVGWAKRFVKCHRSEDGPLPPRFFYSQHEAISEHVDTN